MKLDAFVAKEIYRPLKMTSTAFLPQKSKISRIAPTEKDGTNFLRGVVHDPTARRMGGVTGHAGLFSTAADLARFARMMLNQGELESVRIFKLVTVKLMTSVQSPEEIEARRGLGWDIDSGYSRPRGDLFPLGSYGHTGFTGTAIWIDPFSRTFVIFLSNRVHPEDKGNLSPLRRAISTLAAQAIRGFDFKPAPSRLRYTASAANVQNGIDVLVANKYDALRGMRIGLITNHTGIDRAGNPSIDLLRSAPDVLASTANYLAGYGWQRGKDWEPGSANFAVIQQWNKSEVYSRTIAYFASQLAHAP